MLLARRPEQFSALSAAFGSNLPLSDIPLFGKYTFLIKPTFVGLVHKRLAEARVRTSGLFPIHLLLWNAIPSLLCAYVIGLPLLSPGPEYRAVIAVATGLFIAACYALMEIEALRAESGPGTGSRKPKLKVLAAKLGFIIPVAALWAWAGLAPRNAPLEIGGDIQLDGDKVSDGLKAMQRRGIRVGRLDLSSVTGALRLRDISLPNLELKKSLPESFQLARTNIQRFNLENMPREEKAGNARIQNATFGAPDGYVEFPEEPDLNGVFIGQWNDVDFERCDFSNTTFHGYDFNNVDFRDCTFRNVTFVRCMFRSVSFAASRFEPVTFSKSMIVNNSTFPESGIGCILDQDSSLLMDEGIRSDADYRGSNNVFLDKTIAGCENGRR